jgi:hypothetical protein
MLSHNECNRLFIGPTTFEVSGKVPSLKKNNFFVQNSTFQKYFKLVQI